MQWRHIVNVPRKFMRVCACTCMGRASARDWTMRISMSICTAGHMASIMPWQVLKTNSSGTLTLCSFMTITNAILLGPVRSDMCPYVCACTHDLKVLEYNHLQLYPLRLKEERSRLQCNLCNNTAVAPCVQVPQHFSQCKPQFNIIGISL